MSIKPKSHSTIAGAAESLPRGRMLNSDGDILPQRMGNFSPNPAKAATVEIQIRNMLIRIFMAEFIGEARNCCNLYATLVFEKCRTQFDFRES